MYEMTKDERRFHDVHRPPPTNTLSVRIYTLGWGRSSIYRASYLLLELRLPVIEKYPCLERMPRRKQEDIR